MTVMELHCDTVQTTLETCGTASRWVDHHAKGMRISGLLTRAKLTSSSLLHAARRP